MTFQIEGRNLVKKFIGVTALASVDVRLDSSEIVGIIGPNGSGKTTLFNCMTGFLRLTSGTLSLGGHNITGSGPERICRMGISRTFQQPMTFNEFTVALNIDVVRRHHLRRTSRLPRETADILELTGLSDVAEVEAGSLSYGKQRLLGISMALAAAPELLLMDEPTSGLNDHESEQLQELIQKIHGFGVGIGVIDHNVGFILALADRLVVLDVGLKIAEGPPSEVIKQQRVLDVYLGKSFAERE